MIARLTGIVLLNHIAYGTILPLYIAGGSYVPPLLWATMPVYWYECLFGFRGLFSYQPFLLLIFPAVWLLRKKLREPEGGRSVPAGETAACRTIKPEA